VTTHTLRSQINSIGSAVRPPREFKELELAVSGKAVLLGRTSGREKTSTVVVVLRVCQPVDDERFDGICGPDDVNR
jgi:hypothetical protein